MRRTRGASRGGPSPPKTPSPPKRRTATAAAARDLTRRFSLILRAHRRTPLETTAGRLWKRLGREERLAAATVFFREPPQEVVGSALAAIIKARHLRPQVARTMPAEEQARALASVLDPGEPLAASLLVALHLGERRPMLATFLDAAGVPHEDGLLKDEAPPATLGEEAAQAGVNALLATYPREQVQTYLNTLWLQDPERWAALEVFIPASAP